MAATVGMVLHPGRPEAAELAQKATARLEEDGHQVHVLEAPGDVDPAQLQLAISLGGDGTMLRAVDLVSAAGVPVLGINVGHLGYLTEVEPAMLTVALDRFFSGDYRIEERMTLTVDAVVEGKALPTRTALNEAWLEKTVPGHTVRMQLTIAGETFTTYAADGIIVSTPTGSTAYNLSVRGPIVSPALRAIVIKPVSPHQLFDFSLVVGDGEDVEVEVLGGRTATLLVDGQPLGVLSGGDHVTCRAGAYSARLVRFGEHSFFRILKSKFGLTDR